MLRASVLTTNMRLCAVAWGLAHRHHRDGGCSDKLLERGAEARMRAVVLKEFLNPRQKVKSQPTLITVDRARCAPAHAPGAGAAHGTRHGTRTRRTPLGPPCPQQLPCGVGFPLHGIAHAHRVSAVMVRMF
jgi:hypothetical protein